MEQFYDRLQVLEPEGKEFTKEERLKAMKRPLLSWYKESRRILPWREKPEPYRVWISEIMLQQTRVEAVKPYFERFMEALPDIESLARVKEDKLLKLWEGLGYYNRAKNLKKAAMLAVSEYGGRLPADYEELIKLPGIGSYTAGAILSIAYGIPVPAVDGNVLRVLSRVLASREDILKQSVKKQMEQDLKAVIPPDRASDFNQGLIEIGAIVCVPNGQPKCSICPLHSVCLARKQNLTGEIPVKTPKKARRREDHTVFLIEHKDMIALCKRPDKGLLSSLYELPNRNGHLEENDICGALNIDWEQVIGVERLLSAKHIFSHVEWHMIGYRVVLKEKIPDSFITVEKRALKEDYPLPNAFRAYMKLIK